jgi:hypothetical protein
MLIHLHCSGHLADTNRVGLNGNLKATDGGTQGVREEVVKERVTKGEQTEGWREREGADQEKNAGTKRGREGDERGREGET